MMSLRLQTVLLALLVLVSVGGAVQLPATPQYIPHKTCPLQGCEAPLPAPLPYCSEFAAVACCSPAQASALQTYVSTTLYPAITGEGSKCIPLVDSLVCNLVCSPYQPKWTTRDPSSLIFIIQVAGTTCDEMAACGIPCESLGLPPLSLSLVRADAAAVMGILDLDALPPWPPEIVALGSAASYGLDHGGLIGTQEFQLVGGNCFQLPVPLGGANVTLTAVPGTGGGTPFEAVVTDNGNGTYTGVSNVTTAGSLYTVSVLVNGSSVANSDFHLTYQDPQVCFANVNETRLTFDPSVSLNQCDFYGNNSCCDPALVATFNEHWAYLAVTFGPYPPSKCTEQLEILACGVACSPRNLDWIFLDGGNCTNTTTTTADAGALAGRMPLDPFSTLAPETNLTCSSVKVCTTFCDDIWNACANVMPVGSALTVAQIYSNDRLKFCYDQFPKTFLDIPIEAVFNTTDNLTTDPCFFGLIREPTCADTSYVLNRVPAVAGVETGFDIIAADCFGNRKIVGGDSWIVNIIENGIPVTVTITDNGDGTYHVSYILYTACEECVTVTVSNSTGFPVQNSPFNLSVLPGCACRLVWLNGGFETFILYDAYNNLAYTTTEQQLSGSTLTDLTTGQLLPLQVASLDCNGTFKAVYDSMPDANCTQLCIRSLCEYPLPPDCPAALYCSPPACNFTSWIFFTDTGTRIDFLLAEPVTMLPPAFFGEFDCCLLVTNCELLQGAYCVFKNDTVFQAFLPYNVTVCSALVPSCVNGGGPFELFVDCTPLGVTGGACDHPVVTQLLEDPTPRVRVAAPQTIVDCGTLFADASASTNVGGRPAAWVWTVEPPFQDGDNHLAIQAALNTQTGPIIIVSGLFTAGVTYRFRVSVTNHLDQTGSAVFQVTVVPSSGGGGGGGGSALGTSNMTLFISPNPPLSIAEHAPQGYHAFLVRETCELPWALCEVEEVVVWNQPPDIGQRAFPFLANRTVNQNHLELPCNTFSLQSPTAWVDASAIRQEYVALDWVYGTTVFPTLATAQIRIQVTPKPPYVYVGHGTQRVFVLGDELLVLNASVTTNFNSDTSPVLTFAWACLQDSVPCVGALGALVSATTGPVLQVPPTLLSIGWYDFRLTTRSGPSFTVSDVMIRTNATGPDVTVDLWNNKQAYDSSHTSFFSLIGHVKRDLRFGPMDLQWTASSIAPASDPCDPYAVSVERPGGDAQYAVRLTASDREGAAWAQYRWVANDRPNGGFCTMELASCSGGGGDGILASSKFFLRCSNWEDRQSDPITYRIEMTYAGFVLPLSFGRWWSPYMFVELLPSSELYAVRVKIYDTNGFGQTIFKMPPLLVVGTTANLNADDLAAQTLLSQTKLDSARLIQRVISVATLLPPPNLQTPTSTAFGDSLSILAYVVRSTGSRERASALAQVMAYLFARRGQALQARDFELSLQLMEEMTGWALLDHSRVTRIDEVITTFLQALDQLCGAMAPIFATVGPSPTLSARLFSLLEAWATLMRRDMVPGHTELVARSSRFAIATKWWPQPARAPAPAFPYFVRKRAADPCLMVPFGVYPEALVTPSVDYFTMVNAELAPIPNNRDPTRAIVATLLYNYTLVPDAAVTSSFSLRFLPLSRAEQALEDLAVSFTKNGYATIGPGSLDCGDGTLVPLLRFGEVVASCQGAQLEAIKGGYSNSELALFVRVSSREFVPVSATSGGHGLFMPAAAAIDLVNRGWIYREETPQGFTVLYAPIIAACGTVVGMFAVVLPVTPTIAPPQELLGQFAFHVDKAPGVAYVCAAFLNGLWNTEVCTMVSQSEVEVTCECKIYHNFTFAVLPLPSLPDGITPLLPTPNGPLIPTNPALAAGLAIAALLILALIALIAAQSRAASKPPHELAFVSTGVQETDVVTADNRIGSSLVEQGAIEDVPAGDDDGGWSFPPNLAAVPIIMAGGAAATPLLSGAADPVPVDPGIIWVSEDEDEWNADDDSLLRSGDLQEE